MDGILDPPCVVLGCKSGEDVTDLFLDRGEHGTLLSKLLFAASRVALVMLSDAVWVVA